MDYSFLENYYYEEMESAAKCVRKLKEKIDSSKNVSLEEIFRTPYKDKVSFKDLLVYQSHKIPLKVLLAFHEQVSVIIPPISKNKFSSLYDITPQEMANLYKKMRLIPILYDPKYYKKLDYLDPLIELRPPTLLRRDILLVLFTRLQDHMEGWNIARYLCRGTLGGRSKSALKPTSLEFQIRERYVELVSLGLEKPLIEYLLKKNLKLTKRNRLSCIAGILMISHIISDPLFRGLCGTPQLDEETAQKFSTLGFKVKELIFPYEIGAFLTDRYKLDFPLNADLDFVDMAYRESALSKARDLLKEFEKYVHENNLEKAINLKSSLEKVFSEAREALHCLESREEKFSWIPTILGYGAAGCLGLIHPVVGLLATLGFRCIEKEFKEWITPKIVGIDISPLSVAIWKFEKQIKKIESVRRQPILGGD